MEECIKALQGMHILVTFSNKAKVLAAIGIIGVAASVIIGVRNAKKLENISEKLLKEDKVEEA